MVDRFENLNRPGNLQDWIHRVELRTHLTTHKPSGCSAHPWRSRHQGLLLLAVQSKRPAHSPPTIRYLTLCSLNPCKSSFRSLGIMRRHSLERGGNRVGGCAHFPHSRKPLADGQTLPIAISLQLLLGRIGNPSDCLIDAHPTVSHYKFLSVGLPARRNHLAGMLLARLGHHRPAQHHRQPHF